MGFVFAGSPLSADLLAEDEGALELAVSAGLGKRLGIDDDVAVGVLAA